MPLDNHPSIWEKTEGKLISILLNHLRPPCFALIRFGKGKLTREEVVFYTTL